MMDYDNWVSRLFGVKEEEDEYGDCKPIDKKGKTSNGVHFDLSIDNDWGEEHAVLNLEFKDCAKPKKKSLVHIVGNGGINLYHTLDYIMHCESNASEGQQRYEKYENAFDVARSLLEEFFHKGYETYRVYISDEQKCEVTVCAENHKVAITFDLGSMVGSKEVAVEFTHKYEKPNVYIAYPMDMMISYSELIEALEKDYYGDDEEEDAEEEEDEEEYEEE